MPKVLTHNLKVQRKVFFFWALGIFAFVALYLAIYPSIKDSAKELNGYIEKLPEAFRKAFIGSEDYSSPVGYIGSEIYNLMLPILFLFFSIGFGSSAIAGEEERGTLDILLSNPIKRSRLVLEKFGALAISLFILSSFVVTALLVGMPFASMSIASDKIVAITLNLFLLTLTFGTFALLVGAITGNKGISIGITTAVAVLAFFVNALSPVAVILEKFQKFSPFYYYTANSPLKNGFNWGSIIFFTCLVIAFLILSVATFQKRDLKT